MILNVMKVCPQAKIFLSFRKKIIFFKVSYKYVPRAEATRARTKQQREGRKLALTRIASSPQDSAKEILPLEGHEADGEKDRQCGRCLHGCLRV